MREAIDWGGGGGGGAKPRVEIMADDAGAVLAREHTKLKKALLAAQQAVERLETTESVSVSALVFVDMYPIGRASRRGQPQHPAMITG